MVSCLSEPSRLSGNPQTLSALCVFLCDFFPVEFSCRVLLASTRFCQGLFGTTQHLTPGRVCYCWAPSRPQGGHIGTTVQPRQVSRASRQVRINSMSLRQRKHTGRTRHFVDMSAYSTIPRVVSGRGG